MLFAANTNWKLAHSRVFCNGNRETKLKMVRIEKKTPCLTMKWKKNALTTEPKFICDVFVGLSPQMLEKQTIKTTKEIEGKRIKSCTNKIFGPIQLSVLFMNENDGVSYV